MGSPTSIGVKAQYFYEPVDLDRDEKHHTYDKIAIRKWLQSLLFAYKVMSLYLAPFHGKVHYPAYYFGKMDLSCMVFNGKLVPTTLKNEVMRKLWMKRCMLVDFGREISVSLKPLFMPCLTRL